jgi:hypothetical protein
MRDSDSILHLEIDIMTRRARLALLLTGAAIALLGAALLLFANAPRAGRIVDQTRIPPTVFASP